MASFAVEEGSHVLPDKHILYTATWKVCFPNRTGYQSEELSTDFKNQPTAPPKALVLFVHGFSDHIHRLDVLFETLASRGIQVHGFDQRGWGRSVTKKSERGLTGSTANVMDDITSLLQSIIPTSKELSIPLFLMGHSMGGGETLYYAATGPAEVRKSIRGYLALAPYIALAPASAPSRALVIAGRLAMKVLPKMQMLQKLKPDFQSRDPEFAKTWVEDELCHDTGTLEGLGGMIDRGEHLDKGVVVVKEGSIFIAHGSGDLITSYDASKRFFDKLNVQDKTYKTYEGWYHVCEL